VGRSRLRSSIITVVLLTVCGGGLALAQGSLTLPWLRVANGGGTDLASGGYTLGGTFGQPEAQQPVSSGGYTLRGGFWGAAETTATATPTPTATPPPTGTATPSPTATLAATGTPTRTATATATAIPGAGPSCLPRPNVLVHVVQDRPGHLAVTLTAGTIPGSFVNLIRTVRFGTPVNGTVDAGPLTNQTGPFTVSPPRGVPTLPFGINQVTAGQPVTLPLVVTDNYGDFQTFVGVGSGGPATPTAGGETARAQAATGGTGDCVRRPTVQVTVTRDRPDRLRVTVAATDLAQAPGNRIWSVTFGNIVNATIEAAPGSPAPGPVNGVTSVTFYVDRQQPGRAVTVPLTVIDYYGAFQTFVGGGPTAF
jgi:hypothetical protein